MDQDSFAIALNFHGIMLLQKVTEGTCETENEIEKEKLQMCEFINKRMDTLLKKSDKISYDLPEHSVPIVPIEMFRNISEVERRDLFYGSLDRGHILILRVINDTLPDNYKLLALCEVENHMKLDDLSIVMYLPKLPAELQLAGGQLKANDIIKAAVCSCSIDERKLYVTLDSNILDEEAESVHLGKISEQDLAFFMGGVNLGPSYFKFLKDQTNVFANPSWPDDLHRISNIEKKKLCTFMEDFDSKACDSTVSVAELKKRLMQTLSNANYIKGLHHYDNGNYNEALLFFNKALARNPKNVDARVSRGTLYSKEKNLKRALVDMELALSIDRKHEKACQEMSKLLVLVAKTHIEHDDLEKAKQALEGALFVDNTNEDAAAFYDKFKMEMVATASFSDPKQTSGSEKKDRGRSCSSDRSGGSSSKKGGSKEDKV